MQETIERLSLQAWPSYQTEALGCWLLRYANGYTKRANSVTVLGDVDQRLTEKIAYCETFYQARESKTVFRLPSFTRPDSLDALLGRRGYRIVEPTEVLVHTLHEGVQAAPAMQLLTLDKWLAEYSRLHGVDLSQQADHKKILALIDSPKLFAAFTHNEQIVACGLGVLQQAYFGLFDIVTDAAQRRRGYAARLIESMLSWAIARKAATAYLQVIGTNSPALALYRKLGFQPLYRYWYRVQAD